eukprot:1188172-Prorocentrum_minimum.AAC.4
MLLGALMLRETSTMPTASISANAVVVTATRPTSTHDATRPVIARYGPMLAGPKVGERWEKVGNWTQGEKGGRVSGGVLSAPLPLMTQEDP